MLTLGLPINPTCYALNTGIMFKKQTETTYKLNADIYTTVLAWGITENAQLINTLG